MSEASGRRGLWKEAKYPGDAVREIMLYRRDASGRIELGCIRIQAYGQHARAGSFLPGSRAGVCPEKNEVFRANQCDLADGAFDKYVQDAYAEGWQNYHPEQHAPADKSGGVTIDWMTGKAVDDDDS